MNPQPPEKGASPDDPEGATTSGGNTAVILCTLVVIVVGLAFVGPNPTSTGAGDTGPKANSQDGSYTAVAGGEYQVGTGPGMLAPGVYTTTVPADSLGCFWEKKAPNGVVTNGYADSYARLDLDIAPPTQTFRTSQCGVWKRW